MTTIQIFFGLLVEETQQTVNLAMRALEMPHGLTKGEIVDFVLSELHLAVKENEIEVVQDTAKKYFYLPKTGADSAITEFLGDENDSELYVYLDKIFQSFRWVTCCMVWYAFKPNADPLLLDDFLALVNHLIETAVNQGYLEVLEVAGCRRWRPRASCKGPVTVDKASLSRDDLESVKAVAGGGRKLQFKRLSTAVVSVLAQENGSNKGENLAYFGGGIETPSGYDSEGDLQKALDDDEQLQRAESGGGTSRYRTVTAMETE